MDDVFNDVWNPNYDEYSSLEFNETLRHNFGNTAIVFAIAYPLSNENPETRILCLEKRKDIEDISLSVDVKGDVNKARILVDNTIKHFEKMNFSMGDIIDHLRSQNLEKKEEATEAIKTVIANHGYTPEFSDFRKQVGAVISSLEISHNPEEKSSAEIEAARKAGYVQGVCECVAAVGEDHGLGKKLLTEMNVTKDMAKKFANPETYKALEQGIFAPPQKIEQTQSIKR